MWTPVYLLLVFGLCRAATAKNVTCDDNTWSLAIEGQEQLCFKTVIFSKSLTSYGEGKDMCKELGAMPAKFRNEEDRLAINISINYAGYVDERPEAAFFIGYKNDGNISSVTDFRWEGDSILNFTSWIEKEPTKTNELGVFEPCVSAKFYQNLNWNDVVCDGNIEQVGIICSKSTTNSLECDDETWIKSEGGNELLCFKTVIFSKPLTSYGEGKDMCRELGAMPAKFRNEEDRQAIQNSIKSAGYVNKRPDAAFFIGYKNNGNISSVTDFRWEGDSILNFTSWIQEEPTKTDLLGAFEPCVSVQFRRNLNWNDVVCDGNIEQVGIICSKNANKIKPEPVLECEDETWTKSEEGNEHLCFKTITFKTVTSYDVGKSMCETDLNGFVAPFRGLSDKTAIKDSMEKSGYVSQYRDEAFYIGLRNVGIQSNTSTNDFRWEYNNSVANFTWWLEHEPTRTNWRGDAENCVTTKNYYDFKWNDAVCSGDKLYVGIVCAKGAKQVTGLPSIKTMIPQNPLIANAIRVNKEEDGRGAYETPEVLNDPTKNYFWVPCNRDFEAEKWTNWTVEPQLRCITKGNGTLNVLVVGNSIAYRAFPTIHNLFKGRFNTMRLLAKSTLPGIYSSKKSPALASQYETTVKSLVKQFKPDIIFVIFTTIPRTGEGQEGPEMQAPVVDWKTDSVLMQLQKNFDFYSEHSRKIVVDLPYYINQNVRYAQVINSRLNSGKSLEDLKVTRKEVFNQQHWQHDRLKHINCSKCVLNNVGESLFEGDEFYWYDRKTFLALVTDGIHFSQAGLKRVKKQYEEIVEKSSSQLN